MTSRESSSEFMMGCIYFVWGMLVIFMAGIVST